MIELPEAVCLARELDALSGVRVVEAVAMASPHKFAFFSGDPEAYPGLLVGGELAGARSRAGLVMLDVGDETLMLSDGAFPRLTRPGGRVPAKHQLLLRLDDGSTLTVGVRMYGGIHLLDVERDHPYMSVSLTRTGPLDEAFDAAWVEELWREAVEQGCSLKAFLATKQRVPGVGNGVATDVAWRARIHPRRKVATLTPDERERVIAQLRRAIEEMIELGGRHTEPTLRGALGGYQCPLGAHALGQPCQRCGLPIERENYLGGAIYWCPACQPRP